MPNNQLYRNNYIITKKPAINLKGMIKNLTGNLRELFEFNYLMK